MSTLVLNVDDSEERLRYRTTVLLDAGFEVAEARTGHQAIELAARARPALVLLDVSLPDLDGFEVCERLKAAAATRAIPVLHVSAALCEEEHWVRGLRSGSDGYLREPLGAEVLSEVIRTILRRVDTAAAADRARCAAEARLRQAEKLEALGLLTGGVAHDFNNALTVILGYADMLTSQIGPDKPIGRDLAEIRRAAEHAAGLTRQLLAFSKEQPLRLQPIDLDVLVADACGMVQCLLGETIETVSRPSGEICAINADPAQIQQVLINLAVNARDAMPDGGTLTVETARLVADAAFAAGHAPLAPGRYIRLTVRDTGVGMDEATRARIFDPFFTTKEVGRGTGLGLSTVYGITTQLEGVIVVQSRPNHGTCFDLYFPESETAVVDAVARASAEVAAEQACVLVVEDEAAVRALTARALQRHGYRVLQAADVREVEALDETTLASVDLLLTDMVMPVLSGSALAKRLRERFPRMAVMYMSGYGGRSDGQAPADDYPFLRKPFTASELLATVKLALPATA
jgi:two-component system cell cycle sensor histidine kinase/response regulator CckA